MPMDDEAAAGRSGSTDAVPAPPAPSVREAGPTAAGAAVRDEDAVLPPPSTPDVATTVGSVGAAAETPTRTEEAPSDGTESDPSIGVGADDDRFSRSLWHDGNFLRFWAGQGVSQLGASVGRVALPVLAVSVLDATAFQIGVLDAVQFAAFLLIGLPAGAWVDRWRKRRTMIAADAVRAVAMLAIPVFWWAGVLDFWHLIVVAAVVGTATVFFDVGYQSFVPVLVPSRRVADANGKLETTAQVAQLGGPGIGGALLGVISVPLLFVAEAFGYVISALALLTVRDRERRPAHPDHASLLVQIRAGLRFVLRHPLISRITASTAISNFFSTLAATLFPILVLRDLGFGAWALGLVLTLGAVGGVLGATLASRIGDRVGEGTTIPLAALTSGVFVAIVPLATLAPQPWLQVTLLCVSECGFSVAVLVYNVLQVSMRQRVCPPELLGRMNASIRCLVWGVMPIGALIGGWLGGVIGIVPTIVVGVIGVTVSCLPVFFSPLWGMKRLPS